MGKKGKPWHGRLVEDPTSDCWLWTGATGSFGHGQVRINYELFRVHRLAWEEVNGPIPEGMIVCHHCDVPACCNPQHLFLGTQADNMRDMAAKGRTQRWQSLKTHCPKGHPYDEINTLVFRGKRHCRECMRVYARGYKERQRAANPRPPKAPLTHCKHGHALTPENVYTAPNGSRNCKECQRLRTLAYRADPRT